MKQTRIPQTDSIEELAKFWDTHDLTDFEDELEEVTEPLFARHGTTVAIDLPAKEFAALQRLAEEEYIDLRTNNKKAVHRAHKGFTENREKSNRHLNRSCG